MKKNRLLTILISMTFLVIIVFIVKRPDQKPAQTETFLTENFSNVLSVKGIPEDFRDRSVFCMTDKGTWHGYGLYEGSEQVDFTGFTGPYLMTTGYGIWSGQSLIQIKVIDPQTESAIIFDKENIKNRYLPGRLEQIIETDALHIKSTLWFISNRSAMIQTEITNKTDEKVEFKIYLEGNTFIPDADFIVDQNGIMLKRDTSFMGIYPYTTFDTDISIAQDSSSYQMLAGPKITLEPEKSHGILVANMACFSQDELMREKENLDEYFAQANQSLNENKQEWNTIVSDVLKSENEFLKEQKYQNLAVKSIQTLVNNWRTPAGDLFHDGLFPSYNIGYFHGMWSWDSWKHAVALVKFNPELAKNQMRVMFDYQAENGMIPDVIYTDKSENNWRDTKPPLASWAVWKIYEKDSDRTFIEEFYPKLKKYHEWWYTDRDHDQNGLCEYGSTDGTRIAAAWESGMDNAVRFDHAEMIQNHEKAWSLDQESVDLNSYLYTEKLFLSQMAEVLGLTDDQQQFIDGAEKLKEQINTTFYNAEKGYYYDVDLESKEQITIEGPEGWIPLWAGIASDEQAGAVMQIMMDTTKFNTLVPLPTLVYDHEDFDPQDGYWRGPVWLDQAYFGMKGLKNYGFNDEANELILKLFHNAQGLLGDEPIRENYHPVTGEGLYVNHFSWSAAHLLMLLTE